jgi:DNA-binding IclR family transcriptional regulator
MGTTEMTEDTIKRRARGLDRAFDILDFLKEIGQPLRPNDIANGIGGPKSTVYELVASLLERRILEPVGKDGHVYLGRQLYFLGQAHLRHFDLSREADHALQEIVSQTHETAQMCLLNGRKYTVALMKEGERHFRISSDIGENAPIPWTASGRLLLAHLSDQQIIDLIDETTTSCRTANACRWSCFWHRSARPASMDFSPSTVLPTPLPIASPPRSKTLKAWPFAPCASSPHGPMRRTITTTIAGF